MGAAVRWSGAACAQARRAADRRAGKAPAAPGTGVWAEHRAAALLAGHGVPVVPAELVDDAEAAVAAAEGFGYPVVLKAAAEGLGHKSDVGGVRLGLSSEADGTRARTADPGRRWARTSWCSRSGPAAWNCWSASSGTRRGAWSWRSALGGVWVEVLRDSACACCPVDAAEVRRALAELRGGGPAGGRPGHRARRPGPVDRRRSRASRHGRGLGDALESLEINPLLVRG